MSGSVSGRWLPLCRSPVIRKPSQMAASSVPCGLTSVSKEWRIHFELGTQSEKMNYSGPDEEFGVLGFKSHLLEELTS